MQLSVCARTFMCMRVSLWVGVSFNLGSKGDFGDRVFALIVIVNLGQQLTPSVRVLFLLTTIVWSKCWKFLSSHSCGFI